MGVVSKKKSVHLTHWLICLNTTEYPKTKGIWSIFYRSAGEPCGWSRVTKLSFYCSHPGLCWTPKRTLQMFLCPDNHLSEWPQSHCDWRDGQVTVWPEWSEVSKALRERIHLSLDFSGEKWTRFQAQSLFIGSDKKQRVCVVWLEDGFMLSTMKAAPGDRKEWRFPGIF